MAEAKKIGVYLCPDYDIGKIINLDKIVEKVQKEEDVAFCKIVKNLCTKAGADKIKEDIEKEELNAIVIAGSSQRHHTEIFRFDNIVMDRVNIRELVAWTHDPGEETDRLALDYVNMGIAKVRVQELPVPTILDINDTIMVVGGGAAGMNSALASAKAGYNVILAEKEERLGGFYARLNKLTPSEAPYLTLVPNLCDELIAEVYANPKIKVLTKTNIKKTAGQPGMFNVTARSNGQTLEFQVGAIVQATGFRPYDPHKLSYLGYGLSQNVLTNIEFEERAKAGKLTRPADDSEIKSILFIQCAGSRDPEHLPYCSTVCCMSSLKQAIYVRDKYPNARIYIIYKDLRAMAQYEIFYKRVQNEENIFLTKGEIKDVRLEEGGNLAVSVDDTLIGESIEIDTDMIVLAAGMVPSTAVEVNGSTSAETDDTVMDKVEAEETNGDGKKEAAGAEKGAKILNLTYRQGTDLPTLKYGFPDSHFICFPYETRRTGIYAAGTVRNPMDVATAANDAYGASLKAIQLLESIRQGKAVHPRAGDTSFPDFFLQRCTQCKRCTEECPFGTLDEDDKGTPQPNPNRCRRCGICMGACPERIISFKNYSVRMISDMIKSIYIPIEEEDGEATPRIIAFMCENDAYPSMDIAGKKRMKYSPYVRIIPVRCLGSVNTSWIADSLSAGFDGALLIGCKFGEDYQCHFIKGSELASRRMENVQEKLKQLVLEPERVELHTLSIDEYDKIPDIINRFAEVIEEVGPNPYKEM
ncbi:MAG: hydrogenase iron-sulfur subunit [Candidatus Kapaibacterium sp.]